MQSENAQSSVPVVLVHGFWHGGWCWSLVTERLAAQGVLSAAIDLDGHGLKSRDPHARWARPFDAVAFAAEPSPVAAVTASSAAATLVEQIRAIGGGLPCLVVAHSMGGVVATAAAELAPELIAGLVYVSAFAPVSGLPAASYLTSPENAGEVMTSLFVGDPAVTGALRLDTGDASRHAALRETFYGDVDNAAAAAAIALFSSDGPVGILGETLAVTTRRYGSVPHTYVVCTRDKVIPVALQRRFIKEIDAVSAAPTTVVEFSTSHSPFLSEPTALADVIAPVRNSRP